MNGEFTASIVLSRCHQKPNGAFRWLIRVNAGLRPDITVAVRMNVSNSTPLDYYLLPGLDRVFEELTLNEDNPVDLETFRFDNLEFVFGMARRIHLEAAA